MMPSPQYKKFIEALFSHPPVAKAKTVQEGRDLLEHWLAQYPPPSDVRFEPFSIGSLPACWALAPGVKRQSILLFFHGGGYISGSVRSHWGLMGRLSEASGSAVLGIQYRLAPENPYPAALEDALTAYRWLLHHPYPHNHIALAGSSCGGAILVSLMLKLKLEKLPLPAAGVCLSPWIDLSQTKFPPCKDTATEEFSRRAAQDYCQKHDPKDPFISPTFGDLRGLPPLLIQTGTAELLYGQIVAFAEKAKKQGVDVTLEKWPEMIHCWQLFAPVIPEGEEAIEQIGKFLKRVFQSQ